MANSGDTLSLYSIMIPKAFVTPMFISILVLVVASSLGFLVVGLGDLSDKNKSYIKYGSYTGFGLVAILAALLAYDIFFVDNATNEFRNYRVTNPAQPGSFFAQQMDGNFK